MKKLAVVYNLNVLGVNVVDGGPESSVTAYATEEWDRDSVYDAIEMLTNWYTRTVPRDAEEGK